MDSETRDLLKGSIRDLFEARDGDIVSGLDELGWSDVVADDPAAALDLLFTEQGAIGRSSSALDMVAFAELADGTRARVVHPVNGVASARIVGNVVQIDGVVLGEVDQPVVVATLEQAFVVDVPDSAVTAVGGFDSGSGLRRVRLAVERAAALQVEVDWADVTAAAQRALCSELVGNGTAMLRLAADQITHRIQFGRPIGANQSPRHRLAESYALVRGAAELTRVAWRTGSAWDARTAKAYAGCAVETTSRACLQVCGAIGLTTEHALPGYVKRSRVLDALYGGWAASTTDIGGELLAAGSVPSAARL
ncbi:acyl-CoA dehydrogenase family protein [Mycobacterium sp. URHB0044]|uniref:acyl-CoA dehydrogenase family protein n=1 Tax=Mycobacterium sp. URHB0044 TaxID=1380386 RepID=UPI00048FCD03|nr:acyl-CoA dehydrogenase family protein [Mycobacterium sp. URHB0044]